LFKTQIVVFSCNPPGFPGGFFILWRIFRTIKAVMATVLITGGTGLIGTALTTLLTGKGYRVIILTRYPKPPQGAVSYAAWNPAQQTIDTAAIEQADYIINLAGEGVADKRWSKKRKQQLVDSRVKSGQLLVKALREIPNTVKAVISASGIGWYGPDPVIPNPQPFTEEAPASKDFLGDTCRLWEGSVDPVTELGKRLVKVRTGIVLSAGGGAFGEFKRPVKFGIGAILGSGKQVVSWIHIDDICRIYLAAIENNQMQGVYNAVAPAAVSNKDLTLMLAKKIKGQFFIPVHVPSFALKMVLGEMSIEVLKSATVSNRKISDTGFQFLYPTLDAALSDLTRP
jgi:uncharacterized protein (TIGR01777 family)